MTDTPSRLGLSTRRALGAALAGLMILAPLSIASANGSGGGGSPSANASRFDPAEEYRNGLEALDAGEFDDAVTHFRRVTRVARKNADAQYLLGISYLRAGKANRARRPLEAAVRHDSGMIVAKRDLALVYIELERIDDAQEILADLSELQGACAASCPEKPMIDQAIAAIEGALNGEEHAFYGPDTSRLANAASADAIYYHAVGLINDGEFEAALRQLDEAALAFGPHPDILTYQGFANRKLANFARAEAYYNRALAIAPDHIGALEYYGELKVERGDLEGARSHLSRIEELCSFGCYEAEELRTWIENAET